MSTRSIFNVRYRAVVAALASTALLSTGVVSVVNAQTSDSNTNNTNNSSAETPSEANNWGFSEGKEGEVSAVGEKLHAPEKGQGALTIDNKEPAAGSTVTITGTGFENLDQLTVKFGDGRSDFPENSRLPNEQDPEYFVNQGTDSEPKYVSDGNYGASVQPAHLPGDDGNFTLKVNLPEKIPNGWYWLRFLHPKASKVVWFKVNGGNAEGLEPKTTKLESSGPGYTYANRGGKAGTYSVAYDFVLKNAPEGTKLIAKASIGNGQDTYPAKFQKRHSPQTDELVVSDSEKESFSVVISPEDVAAGKALAFEGHNIELYTVDANGNESTEPFAVQRLAVTPAVQFMDFDETQANTALGTDVHSKIVNLPNGNVITGIHAGGSWNKDTKSFDGGTSLFDGEYVVGSGGQDYMGAINFTMPSDESLLGETIWVSVKNANTSVAYDSGSIVTPSTADMAVDKMDVQRHELPLGLYQSAYSEKEKALFVTRTDFHGTGTDLIKLDGETFKELAKRHQDDYDYRDPNRVLDVNGNFGVAVDDEHGIVWVTNTLEDTITGYDAKTLDTIKQFEMNQIAHPRAVIAQPGLDAAWVSSPVDSENALYYVTALDLKGNPDNARIRPVKVPDFAGSSGFALSSDNYLYTVSYLEPKVLKFNTYNKQSEVFNLGDGVIARGTDVALDESRKHLFAVGQDTNNAVVVDTDTGEVIKSIPTGDGALSVSYDKVSDKVFVANRTAGTLTVIDADTLKKVGSIHVGAHPNHTSVDNATGRVFVVNKRSQVDGGKTDDLFVVKWKKEASTPPTTDNPPTTNNPPSSDNPPPSKTDKTTTVSPKPGSSNNNSSVNSSGNRQGGGSTAALPLVGVLAVVAAIIGALSYGAQQGFLPPQVVAMLPPQVRAALRI